MTETPTPPGPILGPVKHAIIWKLTKGYPIGPQGEKLSRNELGFPVIESEDEYNSNRPGEDFDDGPETSYFHTEYEWKSVDLSYDIDSPEQAALVNFNIKAELYSYREQTDTDPISGEQDIQIVDIQFPKFEVVEMTITSADPNGGGTWVFPDDYDQIVDPNHPKQYGGVILYNSESTDFGVEEAQPICGIEDGPKKDGVVPWRDSRGRKQEAFSGYNYTDVFDQSDFKYIPFNSSSEVQITANDSFKFTPKYPNLKDPDGLAAPIYPMNAVTSFLPDTRESVTVTYTANIVVRDPDKLINWTLTNPTVTIKQTCFQDSNNYGEQLERLFDQCNWFNPGDFDRDEFSPNYPDDYPFTFINGFDDLGLNQTPKKRPDGELLARGDVWYNPSKDERLYFHVADEPEELKVHKGGSGYKSKKSVPCIWQVPEDIKCVKPEDLGKIPFGLLVDTTVKNGSIVRAEVSSDALPQNFKDGDMVSVTGGNNNALLKVVITEKSDWKKKYVEKDETNRSKLG